MRGSAGPPRYAGAAACLHRPGGASGRATYAHVHEHPSRLPDPQLQLPGGDPAQIFPTVARQAHEAEASGFDAVFVMDHFYQLPGLGGAPPSRCSRRTPSSVRRRGTERIQLSALVTGNTYRNPTLLAKAVTALDVVSGGRAVLGIGAGWFELEHRQLGYQFGHVHRPVRPGSSSPSQIVVPMLRGERPTFEGRWYWSEEAANEPRVRDDLPVLVGGSGERKTFRYAAEYADHLNLICDDTYIPRKLEALDQRCAEAGRDRGSIEATSGFGFLDPDGDRARERHAAMSRGGHRPGRPRRRRPRHKATARHFVGSPDEVAEQVHPAGPRRRGRRVRPQHGPQRPRAGGRRDGVRGVGPWVKG